MDTIKLCKTLPPHLCFSESAQRIEVINTHNLPVTCSSMPRKKHHHPDSIMGITSFVPRPIRTKGRKIRPGVYCMHGSCAYSYCRIWGNPLLFFLYSCGLWPVSQEGLHTSLKPEELLQRSYGRGCLSLVPYRLWQVFVLPVVLPTSA